MKIAKTGYIVISLAACLLGVLLLVHPEVSVPVIGRAAGIFMLVFGAVKLVGYFSRDLFRLAFQYDLAFGILLMALGVVVLARPNSVMNLLSVMLGVAVLADGLFKIQIAMDSRRFGLRKWQLIFILAVLAGAAGFLMVLRPGEGAELLVIMLGAALLAEGILNLSVALCAVKIIRHQQPDIIEGVFTEINGKEG